MAILPASGRWPLPSCEAGARSTGAGRGPEGRRREARARAAEDARRLHCSTTITSCSETPKMAATEFLLNTMWKRLFYLFFRVRPPPPPLSLNEGLKSPELLVEFR